jgi:hypothetical protein
LVVYWATVARFLPLALPEKPLEQHAFLMGLGFVAGFSDKLFSDAISQFITKGTSSESKKSSDDKKKGSAK